MVLGGHAQHLHGYVLEGQQHFGAVGQEQVDIAASELDQNIRRFEIVIAGLVVLHFVLETETAALEGLS